METSLMAQGLELMLAGMGTVFFFLTLLVGATAAMSRLAQTFLPDAQAVGTPGSGNSGQPTEEELVAIAAALAQHRRKS